MKTMTRMLAVALAAMIAAMVCIPVSAVPEAVWPSVPTRSRML